MFHSARSATWIAVRDFDSRIAPVPDWFEDACGKASVYAWEDMLRLLRPALFHRNRPRDLRRFFSRVYHGLGVEPPSLDLDPRLFDPAIPCRHRTGDVSELLTCGFWPGHIRLTRWARNRVMLLHEVAHDVVYRQGSTARVESHGPEFVRAMIDLLAIHTDMSVDELEHSAKRFRLSVLPRQDGLLDKLAGIAA